MSDTLKKQELCVYCCSPSTFHCDRCLDAYCSSDCQLKDWNNHRLICFPLPKLMPILRDLIEYGDIDSKLLIEKQLDEIEHKKIDMDEMNFPQISFGQTETNKIATENLQQNGNAKAEFDNIINDIIIGAKNINLKQADDGDKTEKIEEDSGLDTTDSFTALRQQDTVVNTPSELKAKELNEIIEDVQLQILTNDKSEQPTVVTKNNDKTDDCEKYLMMRDLRIHEWPNAKNVKVKLQSIVQSPNIFSFIEDKKVIHDFYQFMESEIEKNRPKLTNDSHYYLPKKNEIVLGQYRNAWYRACVLDPAPEGVIVLFIDYGNMELLTAEEILPIEQSLINTLSFEVCSRQFIVDNVTDELDAKQQEILDSSTMMITKIRVDQKGFYHCEIFGF